ncbi:MAG: M1 family aminopeptidase [bacterium]
MSRASQSALERYVSRRGGDPDRLRPHSGDPGGSQAPSSGRNRPWSLLAVLIPALLLGLTVWGLYPRTSHPLDLTYEVDLGAAPRGILTITMIAEGKLPDELDLEFAPGVYAETRDGVEVHTPEAFLLLEDGSRGRALPLSPTPDGWRLHASGASRVGVSYRIDLYLAPGMEQDVRMHITAPVNGGLRAAGYEIFLEPVGHPAGTLTVAVHNPGNLPFLVPWPALVDRNLAAAAVADSARDPVGPASIAPGLPGFRPETSTADGRGGQGPRLPDTHPVAASLLYHPRDLADLNNALLVCGDIRTAASQARDTVIRFATDRQWSFPVDLAVDLVRRIARTEIGFFGDAPTRQITVMLAANTVTAEGGFDCYGLHTGSSVLVMLHPETTWEQFTGNVASVIAHEMFHGWLGEAIPQTDPQTLWFTEGATTWYAARMLTAAGVWTPEYAREVLQGRLARDYAGNPLMGRMPIATAASEVMASAGQVRFAYAGGVAACMALDQHLAAATGMMRPLDEVLRYLYTERAGAPFDRRALQAAILTVTGVDCAGWLDAHVYGNSPLAPLDRLI